MKPTLSLKEFDNLFVVEYSVSQNLTNIMTVSEMLNNNRGNLERKISSDYVPVAFTFTHERATALAQALHENIEQANKVEDERHSLLQRSEDELWSLFRKSRKLDEDYLDGQSI